MATPRTRRLIKTGPDARLLGAAIRQRRKLQEELIKLNSVVAAAQIRIGEINAEEEVASAAIEQHGAEIAAAHNEPEVEAEPSEADVSGVHG